MLLFASASHAQDTANASAETERELLAVLRSDAGSPEKAVTCKRLAIHGSSAAVEELAKLLPDPQLSSWARIALEAIPGEEADEALRRAADSLEGKLLVGSINSIGVRRDAKAVEGLTRRLQDADAEVACAAAVALGHIGNAACTDALRPALESDSVKVRSAVAEGLVLCAERLNAAGESVDAANIYDLVRTADLPRQRIIEATRGAILARGDAGIPLLLEQFRSADRQMFQLALSTAREFPGDKVDQAMADELAQAIPERAALMIQAMSDREETVVLDAILKAAEQGPKPVRLSAVDALARVGDVSCLTTLMDAAVESDSELALAAKATLASMPGEPVDARILEMLPSAEGTMYPLLIEVVGQRRLGATDELLKALRHSDQTVRHAALVALGETIDLDNLSILIAQVISPGKSEDAAVAQKALRAACVRMPDRDRCAAQLARVLMRANAEKKGVILEIIGDVGGDRSLETIGAAAKSDDPVLQDVGSRLLGKWNSIDAAPLLLDLAKNGPAEKYQIRALRGYIGIIRKFSMSEQQRDEMCQLAYDAALRPNERQLLLDVLQIHPSSESLKLAMQAMQVPELKQKAAEATLVIAQKLGDVEWDLERMLADAGFDKVDLEIIKAEYGADSSWVDVTSAIRKQTGDLQLIRLPSATYNASFGGDPLPGVVKQLKIQYRINGKEGTATFAENALIFLPQPQ